MKMLITLEKRAAFGSNFAYLCILTLSNSPSISPAGHGQLVKMLITLEPHGIL